MIEVKDNGDGINDDNRKFVCLKNYTSKLQEYKDLDNVLSYGFRGEALHSLVQLSSKLYIITKTDNENCGIKLEYDKNGVLINESKIAAKTGTTVHVEGLFKVFYYL